MNDEEILGGSYEFELQKLKTIEYIGLKRY